MKILLVHNYTEQRGGEETYFESLCYLLRKRGHKVFLYKKDSKNIKTFWNKIVIGLGLFWNPKSQQELEKIILSFKPDIAQIHNVFPIISPTIYTTLSKKKIPIVQRVSNYRLLCPKAFLFREGKKCELCAKKKFSYPSIAYRCYRNSFIGSFIFSLALYFHKIIGTFDRINYFIYPTKFISKYFLKQNQFKNKSIINSTFTTNAVNYTGNKKNYFLYVGRLSEEKGILEIIKTFNNLKNIPLKIVGDGPIKKQVLLTIKNEKISFLGWKNKQETSKLISQSLYVIIPSLSYDVLPNVLIEAFSLGTGVIVPRTENFMEFVKDGATGFFYEKNNLSDLGSLIKKIFKNTTISENIGKQAKKNGLSFFSQHKHVNKLIALYRKLAKKRQNNK